MKIKLTLTVVLFHFIFVVSKADEGMWLPMLLKQLNESDMQSKGLKLTAEDIYSINKSSLKDAIVHFGGGCTAEVISNKGLILTNHHCGYGQIQDHSTVQNDLLTNGFWAMNNAQELPNPGLTATFIIRMEDVTKQVLMDVTNNTKETDREKIIATNISKIVKEATANTKYNAFIRPFFYGNDYYMFITETFKDVRLVGAPPSSIGKFGGDTDNWMWPRHTGDFSIFRIYANKNNEPAEYSPDNIPYQPKYVIPISLKGIEEGDFTMVYGFPGRTSEYLSSYGVNIIMNESDPAKVKIRDTKLAILDKDMKASDTVRIKYAAKYASIANYWKKWQGEINGLKKLDALNKKKKFEQDLLNSANGELKEGLKQTLQSLETAYQKYSALNTQRDYYIESIMGVDAIAYAATYNEIVDSLQKGKKAIELKKQIDKLKADLDEFFKDFNTDTDEKICSALLKIYANNIAKTMQPSIFTSIEKKHKNNFENYSAAIYKKSIFSSKQKMMECINNIDKSYKKILNDPLFELMKSCYTKYIQDVRPQLLQSETEINSLNRTYVRLMKSINIQKKYYPDANSTLRVAYGKANGYKPKDGIHYNYYCTLQGVMEKENASVDEFIVSPKLKDLYLKKDFGNYADKNGELRISFCASNHTTGGNSGSPVFNGNGQLIGTNFDRNWEGTMSDIMYNPDQVRNIVLDVRYTLFVIDKFAGAGYLLNEMKIDK
jgi:Peptidase S46